MKRIDVNTISGFLEPWGGLADDDTEVERYFRFDPNNEQEMRSLIRTELKPAYEQLPEETKRKWMEALSCGLRNTDTDFDRIHAGDLPPIRSPDNPRDFFVWLWEELYPEADYSLVDLGDHVVVQLSQKGALAKLLGAHPGSRPIVTNRVRSTQEWRRGLWSCRMSSRAILLEFAMTEDEVPVRFELSINNERWVTGGVKFGTTMLSLVCITHDPDKIDQDDVESPHFDREQFLRGHLAVSYTTYPEDADENIQWIPSTQIAVGDEITVRIVGPGPVDEPANRENDLQDEASSQNAKYVEELFHAEAAYEDAIGGLCSAVAAPVNDFREAIHICSAAHRRYKGALSVAIRQSEGNERDEFRHKYKRVKLFPQQLIVSMTWYRGRMGYDKKVDNAAEDE